MRVPPPSGQSTLQPTTVPPAPSPSSQSEQAPPSFTPYRRWDSFADRGDDGCPIPAPWFGTNDPFYPVYHQRAVGEWLGYKTTAGPYPSYGPSYVYGSELEDGSFRVVLAYSYGADGPVSLQYMQSYVDPEEFINTATCNYDH
jgi:hypothetical protein